MTSGCVLCDEVSGKGALSMLLHHEPARALEDSAHFVALPDIQPLVVGHTLLLTKFHIPAFSGMPDALRDEFRGILARVKSRITTRYQAPILFEHGPGDGPYPGCCVCHAHVHVVPMVAPVTTWLRVAIDGELRRGRGDLVDTISHVKSSYIYYMSADGEDFIVTELECPVPRQFLRQEVSRFLGKRDWNWKSSLSRSLQGRDHEPVA